MNWGWQIWAVFLVALLFAVGFTIIGIWLYAAGATN
jgi:hypothetical protein